MDSMQPATVQCDDSRWNHRIFAFFANFILCHFKTVHMSPTFSCEWMWCVFLVYTERRESENARTFICSYGTANFVRVCWITNKWIVMNELAPGFINSTPHFCCCSVLRFSRLRYSVSHSWYIRRSAHTKKVDNEVIFFVDAALLAIKWVIVTVPANVVFFCYFQPTVFSH